MSGRRRVVRAWADRLSGVRHAESAWLPLRHMSVRQSRARSPVWQRLGVAAIRAARAADTGAACGLPELRCLACDFAATVPGLRLPLGTGLGVAEATFVFTSVFLRRLTAGASNTKGGTPAGRKHDERKCGDPRSPREHAKAPSLQPGRHDVSRLLSSACRRTAGARAFR